MLEDDKSKIDKLRDVLYSRKIKIKPSFVLDLHGHQSNVLDKWSKPTESELPKVEKDSIGISKKFLWLAVVFFVISLLTAGYVFLVGGNVISPKNIKIDIVGPASIKAGEETIFDVAITNNNDTTLEIADLLLEYPVGTRSATDKLTSLPHDRISFGDIGPHTTVHKTIKVVLYGEESKSVHIDMTLEYRIPNSMSVFNKDVAYDGIIGSSPLTVSIDALKEVNANQNYTIIITVTSNSLEVSKDIILAGTLPFGYDTVSFSPNPIPKTTVWNLGDIEPNGKRTITIKGKMYGDHNEERYFKFVAGIKDSKKPNTVGAVIAGVTQAVTIKEPFIGLALAFDRQNVDSYIAESGSNIGAVITLSNNLDVQVYDVSIEASVTGPIVDKKSIKTDDGFYDSNTGIIRWNKSYDKNLATILSKNGGILKFSFDTLKPFTDQSLLITNPQIITDITVHAKRRLESGVPEDIISTIRKTIKISSSANLTSEIVHSVGPIENEGTAPPTVGQKTTYTVIWAVTNTFNELKDGQVKAILPDYVSWTNIISPGSEQVTYNPDSREITWNIGTVANQSGSKPTVRKVAFQVAFTPSLSQLKNTPDLLGVANFKASDTFTGVIISDSNDALDTQIQSDPGYINGNVTQ